MSCGANPTSHKKFCRKCGVALTHEQIVCVKCGLILSGYRKGLVISEKVVSDTNVKTEDNIIPLAASNPFAISVPLLNQTVPPSVSVPAKQNLHCQTASSEIRVPQKSCEQKQIEDKTTQFFNAVMKGKIRAIHSFIKEGVDVNEKNEVGDTLLHIATGYNDYKIVRLLIENGANINAKDGHDQTPLHVACKVNHGWGDNSLKLLKLLISAGAEVNAKNGDGNTSLHVVAGNYNEKIVRFLIENGANVDAKNENDEIPLHWAANIDIAKILIAKGADVNAQNKEGKTPFDFACTRKDEYATLGMGCCMGTVLAGIMFAVLFLEFVISIPLSLIMIFILLRIINVPYITNDMARFFYKAGAKRGDELVL